MVRINLQRGGRLLRETLRTIQREALEKGITPFSREIKRIQAKDVELLVQKGVLLRQILPEETLKNEVIRFLVTVDQEVLLPVLARHHPALADVLSTVEGRKWLESQRRDLKGL